MKLPLPFDTQSVLKDNNMLLKTSNLGLLFNKYVSVWSNDWTTEVKRNKEKVNLKAEFLEKIKQETFYLIQTKTSVESLYKRQQVMMNDLKDSGWYVELFELITDTRLIIGLGGTSVIETGMTLHPLYGFPYLSASGLKGLARAYAEIGCDAPKEELFEVFGSEDKDPRYATNNQQGKVFFMDGLPTSFPKLELDIMNTHYSEYYQGSKPPADYLSPVPVTFLTVAPGQTFSFAVFSRDGGCAVKAKDWLMGGLTELGLGGKTNVGYGYFKVDTSQSISSNVVQSSSAGQTSASTITSEKTIWENATLTWYPGNTVLMATKDKQKAEIILAGNRDIVPEPFRKRLFEKRKTVTANVTVEAVVRNVFRIVKIEVS